MDAVDKACSIASYLSNSAISQQQLHNFVLRVYLCATIWPKGMLGLPILMALATTIYLDGKHAQRNIHASIIIYAQEQAGEQNAG